MATSKCARELPITGMAPPDPEQSQIHTHKWQQWAARVMETTAHAFAAYSPGIRLESRGNDPHHVVWDMSRVYAVCLAVFVFGMPQV